MNRARRIQGFTLLEVLLAMALLALVMLGTWGAMAGATRITRSANAMIERGDRVRAVQQFLRRYVASASTQPFAADRNQLPRMFEGDADSMRFIAPLPMQSGHAGLYLQTLRLSDAGDGDPHLLLEYQPYTRVPQPGVQPVQHVLLQAVRGGRFEYLAAAGLDRPAAWQDRWLAVDALPLAVRIHLDPAWPERVAFPDLVIAVREGTGQGGRSAGGQP